MCSVKLSFCDGYDFFIKNLGAYIGGDLSSYANKSYLESIQIEIDNLRKEINSYQGNANPQLKGFVSETWHTYTFNIDAARKQSTARAYQVQSNTLGSVDVSTNWGEDYSLKYYSTGENSVLAQSHSLEYAYQRYIHNLGKNVEIPTREDFLKMNNIDTCTNMSLGMYEGQSRLIPSDQIVDGIEALEKRIARDISNTGNPNRVEAAQRYIEVRDKLKAHILGPNGEKSLELTERESRVLAEQSKEGKFDPARYDITLAKKADMQVLCKNAMYAGLNAAWIAALLKVVPELVSTIKKLVQEGYIDLADLEKIGTSGVDGAKNGFIHGFFCAAITSSSQVGYLGATMQSWSTSSIKSFTPSIAVAAVLLCQAVADGIKCAKGELTKTQYAFNIERSLYVAVGGLLGGLALQTLIEIPVVSYSLGSMIGSLLGGFVFTVKENVMMSLCVKNGYTIFGLVEQDYTLPNDMREKLGFPIYAYKAYKPKQYEYKSYKYKTYNKKKYNWKKIESIILNRGVVEFRKVGYV